MEHVGDIDLIVTERGAVLLIEHLALFDLAEGRAPEPDPIDTEALCLR